MQKTERKKRLKPDWLKIKVPAGKEYLAVKDIVEKNKLHTICTSGKCPNMNECWGKGTATLMILGDVCTRACKFCAVKTGRPNAVDREEPKRVAHSVQLMKLKHVVITSVDRDDLEDFGSGIWAETIEEIKNANPGTTIETLIPDFMGHKQFLDKVIEAHPEVISHNLETVKRLTPKVRSRSVYHRSLEVVKYLSEAGVRSKSGIMVGIGEKEDEVIETMQDLRDVGCQIMTIGQYLQPTKKHLEVQEYVAPDKFKRYEDAGLAMGFRFVESGPLVRSSYHAEKHVK
ncbi:MAG: lipoyl synthase [Bacteroidales bacterium]|nr:lipoyl synthase [Bacteroidales bacterium]MCF8397797.1 lipoyl synthase [Bacteroidales bacterium]